MIYSGFCRQKFFALKNPIMKFSNFLQLAFWKFLCYAKLWEFKVQTQKQHISIKFTAPSWAIMEGTCDIDFSHCHLFYSFSLRKRIRGMYQFTFVVLIKNVRVLGFIRFDFQMSAVDLRAENGHGRPKFQARLLSAQVSIHIYHTNINKHFRITSFQNIFILSFVSDNPRFSFWC